MMLRGCLRAAFFLALAACLSGAFYVAGFATSVAITPPAAASPLAAGVLGQAPAAGTGFRVFWEAWDLLQRNYYGSLPSDEEMTYGAIRGVVAALDDPHTAFLDPRQAEVVGSDLTGSFEGIGAYVEQRGGRPSIVSLIPGGPAERVGVRPGDVVLAIDGQTTEGLALFDAIAKIRGRRGTSVTLTVLHPDAKEPVEVVVVRDRIDVPTVEARTLADGKVGYVKLYEFNDRAPSEFKTALRALLKDHPSGLILDLRDDPGGYLHVAVDVASQFIADGVIVSERDKAGKEQVERAKGGGVATDRQLRLAVLVNGGSASASEIVAGAIQDTGRGVLIGEKTFGKGSVQVSHDLSDKSQLRVTIAHWFTPNGRQIHGAGLVPDIEVANTQPGVDAQLDRAVQYLLTGG